jgi:FkbM family methyltransferase
MIAARKIFIDVGGHEGQSVHVALEPKFAFDEVHTFEPHPDYAERLRAIADTRLVVHQAALSDRNGQLNLSGDNSHGGATVASMVSGAVPIVVQSVDVLAFVDGFGPNACIFMKINCEGGEVAIVERLASVSRRSSLVSVMVDYDVVKMRFGYWTKRRSIAAARRANLPIVLAEKVVIKERGGLRNWLYAYPTYFSLDPQDVPRAPRLKRQIRYTVRDLRSAVGLSITWRH